MNKTKLLASTMLVSASVLMTAGSASALSLKLGGYFEQWVGYADNDAAGGAVNDFDVKQDSEITFRAEETLNNGMKVGALLEFEAGNGAPASGGGGGNSITGWDESFLWVKMGSKGQINIGNNDVASAYVGGVSAVGPVGIVKSDANDWFAGSAGEINNTDGDVGAGDRQNITYFTPRIAGFQGIVSYTPDASDTNTSDFDDQETAGIHNVMSGAVKYSGKVGGARFGANIGYTHAENDDGGAEATSEAVVTSGWVSFSGLKLGVAYAKENIADKDEWIAVSAVYKAKKNSFSLGYGKGEETQKGVGVADTSQAVTALSYQRNLGKGVNFGASLFKVSNSQATAAASNGGFGLVGGLKLRF